MKTLYLYDDIFLEHKVTNEPGHVETPERLISIHNKIINSFV